MERDIEGMEWMGFKPNPHEREPVVLRTGLPEWDGTGLCAEAQADGVPCTAIGRSCDTCGRAHVRDPGRLARGGPRPGTPLHGRR